MKKSYETFRRNFENAKRIWNLEEDWITPVEYLPYIDALLGDIDLDPCSTEKANKAVSYTHLTLPTTRHG